MELLISIIIPVYNTREHIEKCILSVMNQVFSGFLIECILIDDCSPDDSIILANRLIEKYTGDICFKIVRLNRNMGLSFARNTGISSAKGDYIYFIDSDDYITNDCMARFVDIIKEVPDADVVKGNHYVNQSISDYTSIPSNPINKYQLLKLFYQHSIPVTVWNTLVKRELIIMYEVFFMEGLIHEDDLWSTNLYQHVNTFVFNPIPTYYYRVNSGSIMDKKEKSPLSDLPYLLTLVDELLRLFDSKLIVENTLFIIYYIVNIFDVIFKYRQQVRKDIYLKVCNQRNQLMTISLFKCRLVLSLFLLILYKPFLVCIRYKCFRQNYWHLVKIMRKIALFFNFLHRA